MKMYNMHIYNIYIVAKCTTQLMMEGMKKKEKKQLLSHVPVSLSGKNLNIVSALEKFKYDNRRRTLGDETPMFTFK